MLPFELTLMHKRNLIPAIKYFKVTDVTVKQQLRFSLLHLLNLSRETFPIVYLTRSTD